MYVHCIGHQSLTSAMELQGNILVSGNADSTVKVRPCIHMYMPDVDVNLIQH